MQLKNKKCIECGKEDQPWFSKKRCKWCASKSYNNPKKISEKSAIKKQTQSNIRNIYFETLIPLCKRSEESGTPIYEANRVNICHIFCKRTYKSVQANLDNHVFLTSDEHARFDQLLDTFKFDKLEEEFPNAWKIVLERVKKLLPFVEENKKLKIKFEEYLDSK